MLRVRPRELADDECDDSDDRDRPGDHGDEPRHPLPRRARAGGFSRRRSPPRPASMERRIRPAEPTGSSAIAAGSHRRDGVGRAGITASEAGSAAAGELGDRTRLALERLRARAAAPGPPDRSRCRRADRRRDDGVRRVRRPRCPARWACPHYARPAGSGVGELFAGGVTRASRTARLTGRASPRHRRGACPRHGPGAPLPDCRRRREAQSARLPFGAE